MEGILGFLLHAGVGMLGIDSTLVFVESVQNFFQQPTGRSSIDALGNADEFNAKIIKHTLIHLRLAGVAKIAVEFVDQNLPPARFLLGVFDHALKRVAFSCAA